MNSTTPSISPRAGTSRRGFTIVELLVVIVTVIVLAVLTVSLTSRMRLAAAKASSVSSMRNVSVAVASWMADNSALEPFYFGDGTGDFPHEKASYGKMRPGNPARALYNVTDPDSGLIQDPAVLFSPLVKLVKSVKPERKDYNPANASEIRIWGTYAWFYPFVSEAKATAQQKANGAVFLPVVNPAIEGRYMMSESYAFNAPKFGKQIFHALMSDGSIQQAGDSEAAWAKWKSGK